MATVARAGEPNMTQTIWLIVAAVLLVIFGGFFAGAEAALSRVSRVTADDLERAGRRGAARLQQVVADPARYLNVLTLLRVACETREVPRERVAVSAKSLLDRLPLDAAVRARWHAKA